VREQANARDMERFIALQNARAEHATNDTPGTKPELAPGQTVTTPTATGEIVRRGIFAYHDPSPPRP